MHKLRHNGIQCNFSTARAGIQLTNFEHTLQIVGVGFEVRTDLMLFHTAKWPAIPTLRQFEILKMNKKV